MIYQRADDLAAEGVSHDPDILKRVFVRKGQLPKVTQISQTEFQPGQRTQAHAHPDMYEFYYVLEGEASFTVDERELRVGANSTVLVEPGETHTVANPGKELLKILVIAVEE